MSHTIAIQRIKQCLRTKSNVLDLSNLGLTELPREINQLARQLISLNLENNQISDVSELLQLVGLLRLGLEKNQISNITALANLKQLKELYCNENKISDILPLEKLEKLEFLALVKNQISNITTLANLKQLKKIWLNENQISDILPLQKLEKLELLSLDKNRISNIAALADLKQLKKIWLNENQISDILPLQKLEKLELLSLDKNQISDISALANLTQLEKLELKNNQIADISPLQKLEKLALLGLERNCIFDILPLQNIKQLKELWLFENQIADISPLQSLEKLEVLGLWENQISDIFPLRKLEKLDFLALDKNQISDISALANLKQLEELYLNENKISDISPLCDLGKLELLALDKNKISDISPLENLQKLQTLSLEINPIIKIDGLINLKQLKHLGLNENQISDISPLRNLELLEVLVLANNQINDIFPLQKLAKLEKLALDNNPIIEFHAITGLKKLTDLHFENCHLAKDNGLEQVLLANKGLKKVVCKGAEISDVPDKYYKGIENPLENLHLYYKQERRRVFEAKLLLLGDAESGKSTLTDKLIDPKNPVYQGGSTHAVRTVIWPVPYENPKELTWEAEEEQEKQFTVQIYDFGGQDILKSVHKHFFSEESVYVLVVDTRKADNHSDDWWYRWFQSVRYYGGKHSPIFILFNQREEKTTRPEVPERVLNHFQIDKPQVLYSNLDRNENLEEISQRIRTSLQLLRHVGDRYPKSLLDIRQRVDELKKANDKDKAVISLEDFEKECVDNKNEEVDKTATFLNNLSDVFYFDKIAKDWVILERDWLLYAIYELFWEKGIQDGEGKLCKTDLYNMLKNNPDHKYELNKMDYLLKIMEKYGIIYQSNQKQGEDIVYICPQLSATNRPAHTSPLWEQSGDKSDIFRFKLYFPEFMPLGILYLFMSRASKYIHEQQQWRTGVVFNWPLASNSGLHLVEMIETRSNRRQEIEIVVKSPKTADVFSAVFNNLIVDCLDELDKQNQLQTEYQVACTCSKCEMVKNPYFFPEKRLKKAKELDKISIDCNETEEAVPVSSLEFKFSLIAPRNHYKKVKSALNNPDKLFNKELVMQQLEKAMQNQDEFHQRLKSDYNDAVLAFCQALESELTTIFNRLKAHLLQKNQTQSQRYISKDSTKGYDELYKFVFGTNFLNLGGMAIILDNLKLSEGNKAFSNLPFLIDARKFFFDNYRSNQLQKFVTELLAFNKKDYRNRTAHLGESYFAFKDKDASECKNDVFDLLNLLTDARK